MIYGYRRYRLTNSETLSDRLEDRVVLQGAHAVWNTVEMHSSCASPPSQIANKISPDEWLSLADPSTVPDWRYETPEEVCYRHLLYNDYCKCGTYVLKGPDMIQDYASWPVIAQVIGWGAYVEYERGWRIQHARIEQMWVEPEIWEVSRSRNRQTYNRQTQIDTLTWVKLLRHKYQVPVQVRTGPLCCGNDHEMGYWESSDGPKLVCQMSTSHIVNALKYLHKMARRDRSAAKWEMIFEKELERRKPKIVDGKVKVIF